jgi:hypothetical protein
MTFKSWIDFIDQKKAGRDQFDYEYQPGLIFVLPLPKSGSKWQK